MVLFKSLKGLFERGFQSSRTARLDVGKLTPAKALIQYKKWFQRTRSSYSEFWRPVLSLERGFESSGKVEPTFFHACIDKIFAIYMYLVPSKSL